MTHSRSHRNLKGDWICSAALSLLLLGCSDGSLSTPSGGGAPSEQVSTGGTSGGSETPEKTTATGGEPGVDGTGGSGASGGSTSSGDAPLASGGSSSGGSEGGPTPRPTEGLYETGVFTHPGVYSSIGQLEFIKQKILAGEQPWKQAYDELLATDPTSRETTARAVVPGSSDPKERADMDEMTKDGEYANAAAMLWYFTGEKEYADFAIETLNAWSVFKRTGMPLYLTWAVPHFLNAAELMKHLPGSEWSDTDIEKFSTMVEEQMWSKVQLPPVTYGSNHGATAVESMFAIAVFLDDREKFEEAETSYEWLMPKYLYMNHAIRMDGETNETCRDLNHTKLGLAGILNAAEISWNQGVDLWQGHATRIATMAEFHSGIMMGDTPVPAKLCSWKPDQAGKVFCKGNVPWSSPNGAPPCNEASWETIVNHIGDRLEKKLPLTRKMVGRNRPVGSINRRAQKWTTLLKADVSTDL